MPTVSSYSLITPARNEQSTIAGTLRSVEFQVHPPASWIIVDDGSTDETADVVGTWLDRLPFLRLLRLPDRGHDAVGAGVVDAFSAALSELKTRTIYLGKLDADITLGPTYFHDLAARMDADPSLAIASGQNYVRRNGGSLACEHHRLFHPVGGARLYRWATFQIIGGLLSTPGWDTLDVLRCRMLGYSTRAFADLPVLHERPMGSRGALRSGVERLGRISWLLGYHPLYFAARVAAYSVRRPLLLRSLWLLSGYMMAAARKEQRIVAPDEQRWLRRFQLRSLFRDFDS